MTMILNPNKAKRYIVAMDVSKNGGYCPCMIEKSEDTKCPCKNKREKEICICGLYVKGE